METHPRLILCVRAHSHFPTCWSWSGDPCLDTNKKEVKCRSETPLPPGVFCKFCGYIWWCGCVWSSRKCGKVENFVFIFLSAGSDTIFVIDYRSKEISVIFEKFSNISYQSNPHTGYKICPTFFIKKHKMVFGNLIMICRERLCFLAWLKNHGFRVCEI